MDLEPTTLHIKEDAGIARNGEPVQVGIPLPKGALNSRSTFTLTDSGSGKRFSVQSKPMAHWPDGTVRWLKLNFLVDLAKNQNLDLRLDTKEPDTPEANSIISHKLENNQIFIDTGPLQCRIPIDQMLWTIQSGDGPECTQIISLTASSGMTCSAELVTPWAITECGPVCLTLTANGSWLTQDRFPVANFQCRLRFYNDSPTVELETCIHNPKRARHSGGLWDLGDPGSIEFESLTVQIKHPDAEHAWLKAAPTLPPTTSKAEADLYLYQDSSGGDQWQSRNHVNAEGTVTTQFRGYQLTSGDKLIDTGDRASPTVCLSGSGSSVQASLPKFWQNFPSSIGFKNQQLVVGLFPADTNKPYELQGGERKTQKVWLHYGGEHDALQWTHNPLIPILDARHYETASAFHWYRANPAKSALDELIREGLEGPSNFFAKREIIDEYGWRNFGDIFADHETLYQGDDEPPFISHYNNQYDAIYGFARQFALSGDRRWFELMDDLARHVTDIDIYHTEEDRSEYNNGLFWHTDHYLDAHTATHRTFTKHNSSSSTPGQTGGGPAAEHCYTSGLLYHYFLTGCEDSRQAVFDLANWMTVTHEGQGGLLEQILAIKKYELPNLKALIRGHQPSSHKYPFTRGTGNYLNTLLDAWVLAPEAGWLDRAEEVICHTLHAADDIDQRNLLNAETGWSYLVLLTSINRYLAMKSEVGQYDAMWCYTRDALARYSKWMYINEQLFLAVPGQLEFPNATWVAQDIRKAMLMYQATTFDPDSAHDYRSKAMAWLDTTVEHLQQSDEKHYARIQIILLQNYGPHQPGHASYLPEQAHSWTAPEYRYPALTWAQLLVRLFQRIKRGLVTFRLTRERAWLNSRLDR
ncbi:hypothetical protein [Marinobacter caseinilyticus]|uniref:RIFT barrel domain-containing protein n=1 Tax=Marinobacter caseinilyticus TaxID=2692195 RepID=UPI00140E7A58|nr:hypothetical protein [Marinobacter caseinilyticus]